MIKIHLITYCSIFTETFMDFLLTRIMCCWIFSEASRRARSNLSSSPKRSHITSLRHWKRKMSELIETERNNKKYDYYNLYRYTVCALQNTMGTYFVFSSSFLHLLALRWIILQIFRMTVYDPFHRSRFLLHFLPCSFILRSLWLLYGVLLWYTMCIKEFYIFEGFWYKHEEMCIHIFDFIVHIRIWSLFNVHILGWILWLPPLLFIWNLYLHQYFMIHIMH